MTIRIELAIETVRGIIKAIIEFMHKGRAY